MRVHDYSDTYEITPEHATESIKNVAKDIRGASSSIREFVQTLHQSGAIKEIARAYMKQRLLYVILQMKLTILLRISANVKLSRILLVL